MLNKKSVYQETRIAKLQNEIVKLIEKDFIKTISPMELFSALEGVKLVYLTQTVSVLVQNDNKKNKV